MQAAILFFLNGLFKTEPPAETNIVGRGVGRGPMSEEFIIWLHSEPIGGKSTLYKNLRSMLNIDKNSKKTEPFFSNFLDSNFSN